MSFYQTGYDYFDLTLASLIQQSSSLTRESFFLGLRMADFKRTYHIFLKRELDFHMANKEKIKTIKKDISTIKQKLAETGKYIVKRKLKNMIGDQAISLAIICAGIKEQLKNKKLQKMLEKNISLLDKFTYSKIYAPYPSRLKSIMVKADVIASAMQCVENATKERVLLLEKMFNPEQGHCVSCSTEGKVVKIECGDFYHIDCINHLLCSDIIEGGIDKAMCVKCGCMMQY